jgi:uncharacterized protein YdaU (DUF1376 family)
MHYYQFNIGDYHSHASHLDELEDLAYRRMLDYCYLNEIGLPESIEEVGRLIRMRTHSECIANVLREFFTLHSDTYYHKRVERELEVFRSKSKKASDSANARWAKTKGSVDANALRTECEGNANQEPLTNNHKPITNTHVNPFPRLKSLDGIDFSQWPNLPDDKTMASWLKCRAKKKLVNNQEAMDLTLREVIKASEVGASAHDCIWMAAARGWGGFKADWIKKDIASENPSDQGGLLKDKIGKIMDRSWAE